MKISIGTANFGMTYGVKDNAMLSSSIVKKILDEANNNNIKLIDTAYSYGKCLDILGQNCVQEFKINSKIYIENDKFEFKSSIHNKLKFTLDKLKIKKLDSLMVHNPECFEGENSIEIYRVLNNIKKEGLCDKIGISMHSSDYNKSLLDKFKFDIVQIPFNILDKKLVTTDFLSFLKKKKIDVHVRSIFLQGLLLMDTDKLPSQFDKYKKYFKKIDRYCVENKISKVQCCIDGVLRYKDIDGIVIGINSVSNLLEIISILNSKKKLPPLDIICDHENLINPSMWKLYE